MIFKFDKGWMYSTLLLLFSTFAIPYTASLPVYSLIVSIFFILILRNHLLTKRLLFIWLAVLIYFSLLSFIHGKLEYYRCAYYLCWLSVVYVFLRKKGIAVFYYLEKTIYFFALLSIPFYFLEFTLGNSFYSLMRVFGSQLSANLASTEYRLAYNIIVYTTNAIQGEIPRNCGIYFEPGYHACFIVLSMVLNYFRTKKLFSKQHIYLLIPLLTTISTTGVLLYSFFILVIALRKNVFAFLSIVLLFLVVIFFIDIPFIHDKIQIAYDQIGNYDEIFAKSAAWNSVVHPDRFVSLQLGIIDLLKYPIWGRGEISSSLGVFYGGDIIPSSGLAHLMMYYGGSILCIFTVLLIKISSILSNSYGLPYIKWFIPLFILFISITYYIDTPIFLLLYLSGLLLRKKQYENSTNDIQP